MTKLHACARASGGGNAPGGCGGETLLRHGNIRTRQVEGTPLPARGSSVAAMLLAVASGIPMQACASLSTWAPRPFPKRGGKERAVVLDGEMSIARPG